MKPLVILYVEDNDDLRHTIAMLLENDERNVLACRDAEEALVLLADHGVDVLVTDVSLPGLSGTELARRLLAKKPQHWIVLCSGHEFHEELQSLGPNVRSLAKPFEMEDLESVMDEIEAAAGV